MVQSTKKNPLLKGRVIDPTPIKKSMKVVDLVEGTFFAYNSGRLREACQLYTERMLKSNVTIGVSVTGALTPAGLGVSCLAPLMQKGYLDWVISTGANLYHDAHYGLKMNMHRGRHDVDDTQLREQGVVRIYDILFDYSVLLDTDAFFREIIAGEEFQRSMSSAEFHYLCGKYLYQREKALGLKDRSMLSVAYQYNVPIYTSSPGDSSIGMNIAAMELRGSRCSIDVNLDVNETAAIVHQAKKGRGKSAVMILGGGSPKNFLLQTEPHIQEVLGLDQAGHDYFLQITDARPDTGGLSGATPAEAVSWGKVDPDTLPGTVVCYCDTTIALPLITAYAVGKGIKRKPKRLYKKIKTMTANLQKAYLKRHPLDRKTTGGC